MKNYERTVIPNQVVPAAGAVYNSFTDQQGRSAKGNLKGSNKVTLLITSSINLSASSSIQLVCKKVDGTVVDTKTLSLSGVLANVTNTIILQDNSIEASDYFLMTTTAQPNASTYILNVRVECSVGDSKPLTGVAAPTSETKASLTIQTALKLEAKALGTLGNAVTVKAEANTSDNLAISVTGNDITIQLANATGSKNTMTLIAALIASTPAANALVNAIVITGATQMTAFTVQSLTGGVNGSIGYLDEVRFDTNGNRWEMIWTNGSVYYWALPIDVFPAVNTEYVLCYSNELNKIIYKRLYTGVTAGSGALTTIADGVNTISTVLDFNLALTRADGVQAASHYLSTTSYASPSWLSGNVRIAHAADANYLTRPYRLIIKYIKTS